MSQGGWWGLKSAEKVSHIIWMAPNWLIVKRPNVNINRDHIKHLPLYFTTFNFFRLRLQLLLRVRPQTPQGGGTPSRSVPLPDSGIRRRPELSTILSIWTRSVGASNPGTFRIKTVNNYNYNYIYKIYNYNYKIYNYNYKNFFQWRKQKDFPSQLSTLFSQVRV